ncbi:MAG: hypothetical protein N838_07970 [Thiohalocapsa sp. PB-PSB1]|nr:MAG: hypothetical protein N838_07970 [Thiohalocapsa sp. PB-PSB1]
MNAMIRIGAPHDGQVSGSDANRRCRRPQQWRCNAG